MHGVCVHGPCTACACVWAHGDQGRIRSFSIILCHYLETGYLTGPELSESVSTPQCCVTGMNRYTCLFTWMLGIQTQILMTAKQTLLIPELSPQPQQHQLQTQTFNWSPVPFWPQSPVCSHITHPGSWSYNSFFTATLDPTVLDSPCPFLLNEGPQGIWFLCLKQDVVPVDL